ncbi:MAG: hypothetical protein U9Q83_11585, partial [Bacteroidota bacterium]|nr:hypothetical protein [Bacteroidota bacterium]
AFTFTNQTSFSVLSLWLVKVNANGAIIDEKYIPKKYKQSALSIAKTFDNDFVLAGYTTNYSKNTDGLIIKIDENLNVLWEQNYGNSYSGEFKSVTTTDKYFIATGYTTSAANDKNMWIVKTNTDGEIE